MSVTPSPLLKIKPSRISWRYSRPTPTQAIPLFTSDVRVIKQEPKPGPPPLIPIKKEVPSNAPIQVKRKVPFPPPAPPQIRIVPVPVKTETPKKPSPPPLPQQPQVVQILIPVPPPILPAPSNIVLQPLQPPPPEQQVPTPPPKIRKASAKSGISAKKKAKFHCSECQRNFCNKFNFQHHMSTAHGMKQLSRYACTHPGCTKSFPLACWLREHEEYHEPPQYKCEHCEREYHSRKSYRKHLQRHHAQMNPPPSPPQQGTSGGEAILPF